MPIAATVLFAYAERTDLSGSEWLLALLCGAVLLGVGALALAPAVIAATRQHRHREFVGALAFWWGVVAAWSAVSETIAEFTWKKEYLVRIMTGYMDPRDTSGAPRWPWTLWAVLVVSYGALVVFALALTPRRQDEEE